MAFCFMIIEGKGTDLSDPISPFQTSVANLPCEFDA